MSYRIPGNSDPASSPLDPAFWNEEEFSSRASLDPSFTWKTLPATEDDSFLLNVINSTQRPESEDETDLSDSRFSRSGCRGNGNRNKSGGEEQRSAHGISPWLQ